MCLLDNGLEPPPRREGAESIFPAFKFSFLDDFHAAVESAKTRFRPPTCQGLRSAHDCNGLPSPWISLAGTHTFANASSFRAGSPNPVLPRPCPATSSRASVVSRVESNPTHRISPSCLSSPIGATRIGTARGSPFRSRLLRNVAPLSQQNG